MSTQTLPTYITDSDVRDVYPNIQRYDLKVPVYNFSGSNGLWETHSTGTVNQLFINGRKCTQSSGLANDFDFFYTPSTDKLQVKLETDNINLLTVETGEDFFTKLQDIRYKASRMFDSLVDKAMPKNQWLNEEESFDMVIVRATAQIACYMLISAHEPTSPDAEQLKKEYEETIAKINSGMIKLHFEKSKDSSKGVIRQINVDTNTKLIPVDLRGVYSGFGFDKIRIEITLGGAIGTAKYSTYVKNDENLGINRAEKLIDDDIVSGDYQDIGGNLSIRFSAVTSLVSGNTPLDAVATAGDVYEVEVFGYAESQEDAREFYSVEAVRN